MKVVQPAFLDSSTLFHHFWIVKPAIHPRYRMTPGLEAARPAGGTSLGPGLHQRQRLARVVPTPGGAAALRYGPRVERDAVATGAAECLAGGFLAVVFDQT